MQREKVERESERKRVCPSMELSESRFIIINHNNNMIKILFPARVFAYSSLFSST